MKKPLIILASMLCISINGVQAQNPLDILKKLQQSKTEQQEGTGSTDQTDSKKNALSGLGDFLTGILGIDNVNSQSLIGTWTYKQPAIVFESDDLLTNVGAMAAGKAAEKKLQEYLNKIGFTAGKVKMTFQEDGNGTLTFSKKNIPFQWSVNDKDMTIQLGSGTVSKVASSLFGSKSGKTSNYTSFTVNCKQSINTLQLSFKADKLMQFINNILSSTGKSTNNSAISTISSLTKKVDGMYIGLTLEK